MKSKFEQFYCKKCKDELPFNHLALVSPMATWNSVNDSDWHLGCINCFTEQKQYKLNVDFYVVKERVFKGQEKEFVWKFKQEFQKEIVGSPYSKAWTKKDYLTYIDILKDEIKELKKKPSK